MAYILEKIGNTYNLPKKYFTCDAKSDVVGISLIDVPIGSEAYCILEEESYILDSNKQWHKKKIGEDLTGQAQADLSQTDSTQADYVKGIIRQESLPGGYPYKGIETILDDTFEFADSGTGFYIHQITDEGFTIVDGNSYTVIWDGVTYQCVATAFNNILMLGNLHIAIPEAADTGEPFLFAMMSESGKGVYANDTAATHTITVRGEIVYPIASEFLPDKYVTETELASKGYLTSIPNEYVTETELASKGYLTSETDPTVPAWAKTKTKPSYDFSELTVNDPEAAKTTLAIENGMIFKNLHTAMPSSRTWRSIAYGNGKFVSVADSRGKAAYSEDGITWTEIDLPALVKWNHITYGNGKFIAVAKNSNIFIHSEDGITWTQSSLPLSGEITNIAYSDGKFVMAFARTTTAIYSTDGITWTETTLPASVEWNHITYGNGKFIIIAYGQPTAAYSTDGITWIQTTVPSSGLLSVAYGNNKFVALGIDEGAYSEDGITWTRMNLPSGQWGAICSSDKFVAISTSPDAKSMYSIDGITWIETTLPVKDWKYGIAYGDGKFVIPYSGLNGSTVVLHSFDGIIWHDSIQYLSQNNSNITESVRSVIGIPSCTTANNGQFLRVIDGIPTWTEFLPTLTSPNGTKYKLTVSDDGTLSAVAQS